MIQNSSIPNYRSFYRGMLSFFSELKSLDTFDPGKTSTVMFNNREIFIDNKPSWSVAYPKARFSGYWLNSIVKSSVPE